MPGSPTTPGHMGACDVASIRVAFHTCDSVGPRNDSFAAQWLAYALPYRRFARTVAGACARLRADAVRYSIIVRDSHPLLLAGFTGAPHARVCAHAGPFGRSHYRARTCCLPLFPRRQHPGLGTFRGSMAGPYRRFARTLAGACARLRADAVRYSF